MLLDERPGAAQDGRLAASVALWAWLWGPLGLLMDDATLAPEYGYYQRLVARDQSEAAEPIDSHIKAESPASVYQALLLPALTYAERERLEPALFRRRSGGHRCDYRTLRP